MKRIVVLISGTGSNLQAIHHACQREGWPARIVAVLSNKPDAVGLDWARAEGIEAVGLDHRAHADRAAFDTALAAEIDRQRPDLIVLAGFMRILTPAFVSRYEGRMINIHPSLLPAFSGLHTHQRAIDAGCRVAGATVHLVTAELDHGPIVAQAVVPILDGDDAATLAARVLQQEHRLYPMAVRWFVCGELVIDGLRVRHTGAAAQHLLADTAGGKDTT